MNEFAGSVRSTRSLSTWDGTSPASPLTCPATGLRTGTHSLLMNQCVLRKSLWFLIVTQDLFLNRIHNLVTPIFLSKLCSVIFGYRGLEKIVLKISVVIILAVNTCTVVDEFAFCMTHLNPHVQVHQHPALRPQPGQAPAHGRRGGLGLYQRQLRTRLQLQAGVHRHSGM